MEWSDEGEQGRRPPALRDQRYDWAYIFGAVCPARETGVGLVLPEANAQAMNLHLAEVGRTIAPGAFGVIILDGAGWHQTGGQLVVPANVAPSALAAILAGTQPG